MPSTATSSNEPERLWQNGIERMNATTMRLVRAVNRNWTNVIPLAPPGWEALGQELDLWSRRGRRVRFWWRDDDATGTTPALERLLALKDAIGVPLAIAAVPAELRNELARRLEGLRDVRVLQHGWSHANHAAPGRAKAELAQGRDPAAVEADLRAGMKRLRECFAERFLPVLVPPFNALAESLSGAVRSAGFSFVSVEGDFAGLSLSCRNVQVDPIDWQHRRAKDPAALVRQALGALRLRRFGLVPPNAPIGIVTHHLHHDEAIWQSTGDLLQRLARHPAAAFPAVEEIFAP
jgi:hypothetical protein